MSDAAVYRKLAAILAADVVGYSALMQKDESGTLEALKRHRIDLFDPAVARHNGRIVKLIGDGTLVEFASVLDAVTCAVEVQVAGEQADNASGPVIVLRIGINLGDVIVEGDDIYGNGVNIAARLEPLAKPGGICVSGIVKESIEGRAGLSFEDGGTVLVKNIDRPIHVWNWTSTSTRNLNPSQIREHRAKQTSIAVLPFANLSGDAEQDYFSDGIAEDVITDLSKVSGLLVIARNSSFVYKGSNVDLRKVGRELGVRNVLEGSVRRAGNRVRVTAQLIDAETGGHVWAERYDRDLTDIFAVQDELTLNIVGALKVQLKPEERDRITSVGTTDNLAHDAYLKARGMIFGPSLSVAVYEKTVAYAEEALAHDPNYARAYVALGFAELFNAMNFWTQDAAEAPRKAKRYLERACELDPQEPLAWAGRAIAMQHVSDLSEARRSAEEAVKLDPNNATAHLAIGTSALFDGRPQDTIPAIEMAMRLDPAFNHQHLHFLGLAHFFLGNFDTAALLFRERIILQPGTDNGRVMLAATLGELGDRERAQKVWDELRQLLPDFSVERRLAALPYRDPESLVRIRAALAKGGITKLT